LPVGLVRASNSRLLSKVVRAGEKRLIPK